MVINLVPYSGNVVQRELLGDQIAHALRQDILLGRIKPGTRLAQQQVCERFGTSRMPVRDALRKLVVESILSVDEKNFVVVAPMSRADLVDAFEIEAALSAMAAEKAAARAQIGDLNRLQRIHESIVTASAENNESAVTALNWKLHGDITRMSGSRKIIAALRVVPGHLPMEFPAERPEWSEIANCEHEVILHAFHERKPSAAYSAMNKHIVAVGTRLIDFFVAQGLELDPT